MLGQRHVQKIHRTFIEGRLILDGPRDAYNLNRRTGAAIQPDMPAQRVHTGPEVFCETLIHYSNTRRLRGVGSQEATATHNRNPHGLEVAFFHGVHG